ncbi:hypothetical protein E4T42_00869 [Aureobasidium subglaciale]|nr:hypothetical protein E4T42_00869 [Aureobasidium subglaciale]
MFPVQNHTAGLLRKGQGQGHQRNASESTVNSTGPSSPFMQTSTFPYIANADQSPTTSYFSDNDQTFNNVGYAPSKLSHTPAAHLAMQNMAIDQHNSTYNEDIPDFAHSSRHSVSSKGQNSPSTPQPRSSSDHEDIEERPPLFKMPTNGEEVPDLELFERYLFMSSHPDYKANAPRVELNRTESAAFADELFNPNNPDTLQPPTVHTNNNMLSPHRNLIDERLRTANSIRSQSPVGDMSRERSPFRQNSPFAAPTAQNFKGPGPFLATAADSRRQQREEASAREWMSHQPKLRREPTKTMSPKDALLDFTDTEGSDMPLFADTLPSGYNFATNMAAPPTNVAGFRASSSDHSSIGSTTFNFLPPQQPTMPSNPYAQAQYRSTDFNPDSPPDFPAHLATMESSMSEGPGASSQGSMTTASISRPQHTTADTGSYTCPADGCYHRFDSAATLLKHRRDAHPARQSLSSTGTATSSPEEDDRRSSSPVAAPGTLGSSMTAAALAERNSQQGPHKCTRTNPSTGKPCNSIFSRPYDLTRHEDTIHNRQKQKVRCQYCREEKTFSRADALTRHMRVVHPEVDFHGKRGRKGDHF